ARANDVALADPRLYEAARATGADVPVCLDPRPRLMWGIGEELSAPLNLPPLPAVLVNPGVAVATKDVFAGWGGASQPAAPFDLAAFDLAALEKTRDRQMFLQALGREANDLERPAIKLAPVIAEVIGMLRAFPGCRLARMSGSGATCFAVFDESAAAQMAAEALRGKYPLWWVQACQLGGAR
ncbi:MAG: 4-(cytidine 5'-diphospho)-2-C-methyl-D-erythritol kinase, partial [Xanthobacteraceae bacterium]